MLKPRQYLDDPFFALHVIPHFWSRGPTVSSLETAPSVVLEHEMPSLSIFELIPRLSSSVLNLRLISSMNVIHKHAKIITLSRRLPFQSLIMFICLFYFSLILISFFYFYFTAFECCSRLLQCPGIRKGCARHFKYRVIVIVVIARILFAVALRFMIYSNNNNNNNNNNSINNNSNINNDIIL